MLFFSRKMILACVIISLGGLTAELKGWLPSGTPASGFDSTLVRLTCIIIVRHGKDGNWSVGLLIDIP